ncbi:MAG TPA: phosphate ABC transporter ATP-binding protein, partial [Nitrospiraceae bacterium]|nr:phosphate ABC transporter ATP-binding protein [Nitrospiraceae bacterium]
MSSEAVEIKNRLERCDSRMTASAQGCLGSSAIGCREPARLFWHISDLTVSYGEAIALSSVSIDIAQGSVTAIIGPSGCGKSSFLCCLNRLTDFIPGCCVSGRILMGPQNILGNGVDDTQLRKKVGLIFQKPNPFPLSIKRNLELPLREHGMRDQDEIDATIEETLRATGLWKEVKDRLKMPAHQLSGGQQQRLCIARALALRPDALLMDEPCSALDPIAAGAIEELVLSLRERYTIVIVTHNLRQARRLGTDVAFFWMQDGAGTLIESGPAS